MLSAILLIGTAIYFLYKWIWPKLPANFPPGPPNYPIVGGTPALKNIHPEAGIAFMKLGEKYGPLTGLYLGKRLGIIVNGYETIKQVLTLDEFNGRPDGFDKLIHTVLGPTEKGLMMNNGEEWKEQRRFALRHLRDLGFGKSSLEGVIHDEIEECIRSVQKNIQPSHPREGVSVENIFGVSIINVLWQVVAGKRFKHDDEEFKEILAQVTLSFRSGDPASNFVAEYPFLRYLPYFRGSYDAFANGAKAMRSVLEKAVLEHKVARKSKQSSNDFINEYLNYLENGSGNAAGRFNENQLTSVCSDLFGAGAESTANSLAFALLYMLRYPSVQVKVQAEIDSVVGKDRLPSLDDRPQLPYTEAVMEEVFRVSSIAPLTVPHETVDSVKLNGYTIPKNTVALVNLHSVHMDKDYWGDPETFRPERFLDAQGKFVKSDRLFPFGFGKRVCPGESLARMNYFLFFTGMMQRYKLEMVPGTPPPSTEPLPGFTIAPKPFKALMLSRK